MSGKDLEQNPSLAAARPSTGRQITTGSARLHEQQDSRRHRDHFDGESVCLVEHPPDIHRVCDCHRVDCSSHAAGDCIVSASATLPAWRNNVVQQRAVEGQEGVTVRVLEEERRLSGLLASLTVSLIFVRPALTWCK